MSDVMYELAIRLAVTAPTVMIVFALVWYVGKLRGVVATGAAFNAANLRTWPLTLVLSVAAVFAVFIASTKVAFGDSTWSGVIANGVAALVAFGVVPRLWAHVAPQPSPSSNRGTGDARVDE